jgi:hypothetical protein
VRAILTMDTVVPTAHCLCWTGSFVEAVARDAICGIAPRQIAVGLSIREPNRTGSPTRPELDADRLICGKPRRESLTNESMSASFCRR